MIIEFAEERIDPMQEMMERMFENSKILISDKVLERLKKWHSYTKTKNQYIFHRRIRGTNVLFSFKVTEGQEWNTVSDFECIITEASVKLECIDTYVKNPENVYIRIKGERRK